MQETTHANESRSKFDSVVWLRNHYRQRKEKNEAYSLRSFARDIGQPSGRLSEFLSRKRPITGKMFCSLARRLESDTSEADRLMSIARDSYSSSIHSMSCFDTQQLDADQFNLIAEWYHFAILSLINLDEFNPDPVWIGRRLGVDSVIVRDAIERLHRLGLIKMEGEKIKRTSQKIVTTDNVASEALRRAHRQGVLKGLETLDSVKTEMRDVSSITMAIDVEKLPEARAIIRKFKRSIAKCLERGKRSEVYELNVLLTPLTKI